jgi:hypothetical protein
MQLSIEQIEQEMIEGDITPRRISQFRVYLAAIYSLEARKLQEILAVKSATWLAIRGRKNSDTAADREWDACELGQREIAIKMTLKRIDKLSSALSSMLRVKEGEVRNQF